MNLKNYEITLGELMQNPRACQLLQRELPSVMKNPMIGAARAVPLRDIVGCVEQNGNVFYRQKLASILQKLTKL